MKVTKVYEQNWTGPIAIKMASCDSVMKNRSSDVPDKTEIEMGWTSLRYTSLRPESSLPNFDIDRYSD